MRDSAAPTESLSPELRKEQQEHRRLCFARHCWRLRHQQGPSGRTWAEVFARNEGLTLDEYAQLKKQGK